MLASAIQWVSQVVLVVKNLPANAGDIRDTGWAFYEGGTSPLSWLHVWSNVTRQKKAWDVELGTWVCAAWERKREGRL